MSTSNNEILRNLAFISINNHDLDRNFTFKVVRSANSLISSANIHIKKNYFLSNRIQVNNGDQISISLQNNDDDKVVIFNGIVTSVSTTATTIYLTAGYRVVDDEIFDETYKDSCLGDVLPNLVSKLEYSYDDPVLPQIIVKGKKEASVSRLLQGKNYFTDLEQNLVVSPDFGATYNVDHCLHHVKNNQAHIFPIPKLDIFDIIEFIKQKFIVKGIVYNYKSRAKMYLNLEKFNEPQKSDVSVKDVEHPPPNPITPLFVPSETQYERCETTDSLLNQLNPKAKIYIENLATQVRDEMGDDFKSIVITSVYRSKAHQIKEVFLKKIILTGNSSMYGYYQNRATSSAPYLKIIQYLYDGIYSHKITSSTRSEYLADLNGISNVTNRAIFQGIIEEKYNDTEYVIDSYEKDIWAVERLLTKSYVEQQLFNPSFHTITDSNNNPSSWAIDFRVSDSSNKLIDKFILDGRKKYYYKISSHIHFTIYI